MHLAAAIGNGLEWFDFAIYGYFASDIGRLFFPSEDHTFQLISSFAVFSIGYLMRPVGSLVLGPIGDLLGRRTMLISSVVTMSGCSLLISLLPTDRGWGPWAAYALLLLRMLQGLSLGGEYTGSLTFVYENARPEQRGWQGAVAGSGSIAGFVAGAISAALVYGLLPKPAVLAWGWRVPFLAGALIGFLGLWLRSTSLPAGEAPVTQGGPLTLIHAIWKERIAMLQVMAAISFADIAYYLVLVFEPQNAIRQAPELASRFSLITAINEALGIGLVLLGGWLADRFGARRCMQACCLLLAAVILPADLLMQQAQPTSLAIGQLMAVVPLMLILGAYPALLPGLFPANQRCTSFSLAYSLVVAVLGGTAPLLATWMVAQQGWTYGPAAYTLLWLPACLWALGRCRVSGAR